MAAKLLDQWAGTRWASEPHIRFGDPCYDCAVPMTPASRCWSAFTIPEGMRKHAGDGLCTACANRRRRTATQLDRDADRRMAALARSIVGGRPCAEHGRLHPGVMFPLAGVGLFLWGFAHGGRTPDGRWILAVAIVGLVVLLFATGIIRYRRAERQAKAYTKRAVKGMQQDTSGEHYWDGA